MDDLMGFFDHVAEAMRDPILGVQVAFLADTRPHKVNLGIGVYKTEGLTHYILPSVAEAEKRLNEKLLSKEYLPIEGEKNFLDHIGALSLGQERSSESIFAAQTVGGTGALRLGGVFLRRHITGRIFLPDPTWDNHHRIFSHAGLEVGVYRYYDREKRGVHFPYLVDSLLEIPSGSAILFHACCHNPTGCDLTHEQWREVKEIVKKRSLLPFFDLSYQGLGDGLQEDAFAVRLFAEGEGEFLMAASLSKNFGLYAERVGALLISAQNGEKAKNIGTQVKVLIRGLYSNPPCHGARVVSLILEDPSLHKQWEGEVNGMRERITNMRALLVDALQKRLKRDFSFLLLQKGMCSYIGLQEKAVERLIGEFAIHMPKDGRINVAGLNKENIDRVANAIAAVSNEIPV